MSDTVFMSSADRCRNLTIADYRPLDGYKLHETRHGTGTAHLDIHWEPRSYEGPRLLRDDWCGFELRTENSTRLLGWATIYSPESGQVTSPVILDYYHCRPVTVHEIIERVTEEEEIDRAYRIADPEHVRGLLSQINAAIYDAIESETSVWYDDYMMDIRVPNPATATLQDVFWELYRQAPRYKPEDNQLSYKVEIIPDRETVA